MSTVSGQVELEHEAHLPGLTGAIQLSELSAGVHFITVNVMGLSSTAKLVVLPSR